MIPKILHQTWKTAEIPESLKSHQREWLKDSSWDYRFYTDEDLLREISEVVPQYISVYQRLRHTIERVDFARYVLLYKYGGMYADLDTEPVGEMDNLLLSVGSRVIIGTEPTEHATRLYKRPYLLCNALMMSTPQHPFWLHLLDYLVTHYNPGEGPVATTGPLALTRFYEAHPEWCHEVKVLPPCAFYPIMGKGIPEAQNIKLSDGRVLEHVSLRCAPDGSDIYAAHFWANTWVPSVMRRGTQVKSENPKVPKETPKNGGSSWGWGFLVLLFFLVIILLLLGLYSLTP